MYFNTNIWPCESVKVFAEICRHFMYYWCNKNSCVHGNQLLCIYSVSHNRMPVTKRGGGNLAGMFNAVICMYCFFKLNYIWFQFPVSLFSFASKISFISMRKCFVCW
jgi:hypothetical protein